MSALTPAGLRTLRESDRADPVTLLAFLLGTALGVLHPVGLVVGAVLVGVVATTPARAVVLGTYLAGLTIAVLSVVAWLSGHVWSVPFAVSVEVVVVSALVAAVLVAGGTRLLV